MKHSKTYLVATMIGLLAAGSAFAATQGDEGTTSTGTAEVDVVIPKLVKITGLTDVTDTFDGNTAYDESIEPVIYSNLGVGGSYSVRVDSVNDYTLGTADAFYVGNNANTAEILFTAHWNDQAGTSGEVLLTEGSAQGSQTGYTSDATSTTANANLRIRMSAANMLAVPHGTYGATLTILITPE